MPESRLAKTRAAYQDRMTDKELGVSIRFVQQWNPQSDKELSSFDADVWLPSNYEMRVNDAGEVYVDRR